MEKSQTRHNSDTRYKVPEPPMYNVIMHNDDVTTMDFVVMVLVRIFRKTQQDAETLMMKIHTEGSAVAGTYTYDIAHSKTATATRLARQNGFPLKLTVEEA